MIGHIRKLYLHGLAGNFLMEFGTSKIKISEVKTELIENNS